MNVKKNVMRLYKLLIVSSVFSYLFYAIEMIKSKAWVLWTYSTVSLDVSKIGIYFVYLKDIIAVLIFATLFQNGAKILKVTRVFCGVFLYGISTLCLNGTLNISYLIAGFRALLYFMVALLYAKQACAEEKIDIVLTKTCKTVSLCVFAEVGIAIAQVFSMGIWNHIGSGGYRLCGTFGNAAALGAFCVASIFVIFVDCQKSKRIRLFHVCVGLLCFFLSISSGSRMSMMLTGVTFLVLLNDCFGTVVKLRRRDRLFVLLCVATISMIPMYSYMIAHTGRGNIMISGSSRIDIFLTFFTEGNLIQFLFGHGIGYGTNVAINMGIAGFQILDGTFTTILAQFGVIGLLIFILGSFFVFRKFFRYNREKRLIAIIALVDYIVMGITINIFEQISFNVIAVMVFFLILYAPLDEEDKAIDTDKYWKI